MGTMPVDKTEALRRTMLLGTLDNTTLDQLAQRAIERKLSRNEVIIVEGENVAGLYVVVEGSVRAYRTGTDGREQVIHVEGAGGTFAEVPVFDDGIHPSTVAAESDAIVLLIKKADVRYLCMKHPEIGLAALRVLASRLRHCAELAKSLSLHEVGQRLARFFLDQARTNGVETPDGIRFELNLSKEQIATRLGSVREVVSRATARMQKVGLIKTSGRELLVPDMETLSNYAEGG